MVNFVIRTNRNYLVTGVVGRAWLLLFLHKETHDSTTRHNEVVFTDISEHLELRVNLKDAKSVVIVGKG